jgi:tRNA(Ile)-lysidine synthase
MVRRVSQRNDSPLSEAAFAALMRPFAPFERRPVLALAVSGGRDSRALALLARRWAARRGGRVVALVVDHGLRPEAAKEAAQTRAWLRARAIEAHVLPWRPAQVPGAGLQAAARAARYRLLLDWCRAHGVLHLLTAHQADDQAETYALRLARDSGPSGLAAMSAVVEFAEARLLRPLLPIPRARLTATLQARGETWIDDPSNRDARFARTRLRHDGLPVARATALGRAQRLAARRVEAEAREAMAVAGCVMPHPLGGALLDATEWRKLSAAMAGAVLASAIGMVTGAAYAPRRSRVAGAVARLWTRSPGDGKPLAGLTVGGCRIVWRGGGWLIVREPAASEAAGTAIWQQGRWDRRFERLRPRPMRRHGRPHATVKSPTGGAPCDGTARADTDASGQPSERGETLRREPAMTPSARRALWARAWPATPGLPALLAALPARSNGGSLAPSEVDGAARGGAGASQDGAAGGAPAGMVGFRPGRPLAAGPFFPCFAAAKGQIVNRAPPAPPTGGLPRRRQPDGSREPV